MSASPAALPTISVVMATYNGEAYLPEQLRSVVEQLAPGDELVVSDDRSTDNTLAIVQEIAGDRARILITGGRLGPIRNFEHALAHAAGDVIVLADQDDVWLPGRLQRVRDHFTASAAPFDLLVMNSTVTDGQLRPTHDSLFKRMRAGPGQLKNVVRNTYVGCHMAFRRSLLDVAMPFPPAIPMHDMWLGLASEWVGPVRFDPVPSMLWRRTGQNYTKARYSTWQRLVWRVGLIRSLLGRRLSARYRRRVR